MDFTYTIIFIDDNHNPKYNTLLDAIKTFNVNIDSLPIEYLSRTNQREWHPHTIIAFGSSISFIYDDYNNLIDFGPLLEAINKGYSYDNVFGLSDDFDNTYMRIKYDVNCGVLTILRDESTIKTNVNESNIKDVKKMIKDIANGCEKATDSAILSMFDHAK